MWEGVPERNACLGESGAVSWASMSLFHTTSLVVDSSFRQELESFSGHASCTAAGWLAPTTASLPCLLGDLVTTCRSRAPHPAASPPSSVLQPVGRSLRAQHCLPTPPPVALALLEGISHTHIHTLCPAQHLVLRGSGGIS